MKSSLINTVIPHSVAPNETLLRAIFKPLFFSNNKLTEFAFLPSKYGKDSQQLSRVSVFRKDYANEAICKSIAIQIKIGAYIGFVAFVPMILYQVNDLSDTEIKAHVIYTPLDDNNDYLPLTETAGNYSFVYFNTDKGTTFHAEIEYEEPLIFGTTNTKHRHYAKKLMKLLAKSVFIDSHPDRVDWQDVPIRYT